MKAPGNPGPWKVKSNENGWSPQGGHAKACSIIVAASKGPVLEGDDEFDTHPWSIALVNDPHNPEVDAAGNARLMAAAPEMHDLLYEAAHSMTQLLKTLPGSQLKGPAFDWWDKATDLLGKISQP